MRDMIAAQFAEHEARVSTEQRRGKVLALLADRFKWCWLAVDDDGEPLAFAVGHTGHVICKSAPFLIIGEVFIPITEAEIMDLGPCPNL